MQIGDFHAAPSDAPTNYFAEALPTEQAATSVPSNSDVNKDAEHVSTAEPVMLPSNPEIDGTVNFSKLGTPGISPAAGDAANSDGTNGGVVLSTFNNEMVSIDPSNSSITDLISGDDAPLDARQAVMELEIRHALLDVRDTLSDISHAINDNTFINFPPPYRTTEPSANGRRYAGGEAFDDERKHSSTDDTGDHGQFADKIIHIIATISIAIRDYFWLLILIYLIAITLRWVLKRH